MTVSEVGGTKGLNIMRMKKMGAEYKEMFTARGEAV